MGNRMTGQHKGEIANLMADFPGARTEGFAAEQTALWLRIGGDLEEAPRATFRPDAYLIDEEAKELLLFEVEVTSFLSDTKCAALGYYWFEWDADDSHDWLPVLITVDRHGTRAQQSLSDFYYRYVLSRTLAEAETSQLSNPGYRCRRAAA